MIGEDPALFAAIDFNSIYAGGGDGMFKVFPFLFGDQFTIGDQSDAASQGSGDNCFGGAVEVHRAADRSGFG